LLIDSAATAAFSVAASTAPVTHIRAPPTNSISIDPPLADLAGPGAVPDSGTTVAATKPHWLRGRILRLAVKQPSSSEQQRARKAVSPRCRRELARRSIAQPLKQTLSDWLGALSRSGTAVRGRVPPLRPIAGESPGSISGRADAADIYAVFPRNLRHPRDIKS
jgi:hypothetical protein